MIREILDFSRGYKRKSKKERRNSLNGAELFKSSNMRLGMKYSSDQEESSSEYSFALSHGDEKNDDY